MVCHVCRAVKAGHGIPQDEAIIWPWSEAAAVTSGATAHVVMVSGFDPLQPARKAKVINTAIKYTRHNTGDHLILLVNQAILVPEVDHCLLCPMQCRINGVAIHKLPRFLTLNPTTSTHSIVIADPTGDVQSYTILL